MAAAFAVAMGTNAWWTLSAGIADELPASDTGADGGAWSWVSRVTVWTLQIVGAFPFRDQPAPAPVYVLYFAVIMSLLVMGVRASKGRTRAVLLCSIVATAGIPVVLTALTSDTQGVIWQGRYLLPFVVGVPILCGILLDTLPRSLPLRVLVPAGLAVALAHALSVLDVASDESRRATSQLGSDWITLPPLVLGGMMIVAWALLLLGVEQTSSSETDTREHPNQTGAGRASDGIP
jgi:hypothetical protein